MYWTGRLRYFSGLLKPSADTSYPHAPSAGSTGDVSGRAPEGLSQSLPHASSNPQALDWLLCAASGGWRYELELWFFYLVGVSSWADALWASSSSSVKQVWWDSFLPARVVVGMSGGNILLAIIVKNAKKYEMLSDCGGVLKKWQPHSLAFHPLPAETLQVWEDKCSGCRQGSLVGNFGAAKTESQEMIASFTFLQWDSELLAGRAKASSHWCHCFLPQRLVYRGCSEEKR